MLELLDTKTSQRNRNSHDPGPISLEDDLVPIGKRLLGPNIDRIRDLAESWEVSADGLTYTFHLRSDARWHDNQPVTAADVVFTLSLLQDPNFLVAPELSALWRTVKVEDVNSLTVEMTLQEPLAPFLQYVAAGNFGVLPKHALPGVTASNLTEQPFNRKPIGSGPFQLEEFGGEAGQPAHILLSAFPGYYNRQPYIAKIDFKLYPDFPSLLSAYRAGEVQGARTTPPGC